MRILLINTFHYLRGGDCRYTFNLTGLLESKGHSVILFAMHHPQNVPSRYSKYFLPEIDYVQELQHARIAPALKVMSRAIYSFEARQRIEQLIAHTKPDLAHIQNIHHHITPSILHSLRKKGIPVVWTLHDYVTICPNTSFLNNGAVCEACKRTRYYQAPLRKCKKRSFTASLMAAAESCVHRILRIYRFVDKFITPSAFLRRKLVEYGFYGNRIVNIPNFLEMQDSHPHFDHGGYFSFIGRLSSEKGLETLIQASMGLNKAPLVIVGDGPLRQELETLVNRNEAKHIQFVGYKTGEELRDITSRAMFVVVPSEWYENFPFSVLEAFAYGKPVIGARIGGIPEQIDDGVNGLLFEPGNVEELTEKIQYLWDHPAKVREMGKHAREKVGREYNADVHYERLMNVYNEVLSKS